MKSWKMGLAVEFTWDNTKNEKIVDDEFIVEIPLKVNLYIVLMVNNINNSLVCIYKYINYNHWMSNQNIRRF